MEVEDGTSASHDIFKTLQAERCKCGLEGTLCLYLLYHNATFIRDIFQFERQILVTCILKAVAVTLSVFYIQREECMKE